jgi:ariadne-1
MPAATSPVLTRQSSYVVLDNDSLQEKQEQLIRQTAEVLFVTPEEAGCLLRHYGWKGKALQAEWFEDQSKIRAAVGLTSDEDKRIPARTAEGLIQCQSAYCDEVAVEQSHALNCGHSFCSDWSVSLETIVCFARGCSRSIHAVKSDVACFSPSLHALQFLSFIVLFLSSLFSSWTNYLTSQISHGAACVFTTCMGMRCQEDHVHKMSCSCKEMVPESLFSKFVKDEALLVKYKRWLLDSYVEGQRQIKWCPKPGCTYAVTYNSGGTKSVLCRCGYAFCFSCKQEAHSPCPCDIVAKWLQREKSDDATEIWLAAKTKVRTAMHRCRTVALRFGETLSC